MRGSPGYFHSISTSCSGCRTGGDRSIRALTRPENRRVGTDAQGQRQDGDRSEAAILTELPERVPEILGERVYEGQSTLVAEGLDRLGDATDAEPYRPLSVRRRTVPAPRVLRGQFDMEAQFFLQIGVRPAPP